jgi:hypothetical protein
VGDNIKLYLKEIGYNGANIISVVHGGFCKYDNKPLVAIEKGHFLFMKECIVLSKTCYSRRRWKENIINQKYIRPSAVMSATIYTSMVEKR